MGSNWLVGLDIEGLRNIHRARLESDAPLVWLSGKNGAGKSTVLEAIYLLARGRTYRGTKFGPVVNRNMRATQIRGCFSVDAETSVEIRYRQDGTGSDRETMPPDAFGRDRVGSWFPLKLVTDNPQGLIEGDPQLRRLFLDWNGLLWNNRLGEARRTFQRVLTQRNAALKGGGKYSGEWNRAFVETGEAVDALRSDFVSPLRSGFDALKGTFRFLDDVELVYERGWRKDLGLGEMLDAVRSQETARGFSVAGPHRADLLFVRDGRRAAFSRGQMKVVVCLLQLACEGLHVRQGLERAIWLLDDIESDLDEENACSIWSLFVETGSQLFASGVYPRSKALDVQHQFAMFHVEHGALTRQD